MSAIWGQISLTEKIDCLTVCSMAEPYKQSCKLDSFSSIVEDHFFLSCGLLHINEFDKKEVMPIYDEDAKTIFVADCIIDNRPDTSKPNGQLLYELYKEHGLNFVHYIRGLFSVAIYHKDSYTLELITDPVSSRSLYYYVDKQNQKVTFSTLLRPIKNIYPDLKLSDTYLLDYLSAPGLKPNLEAGLTPYDSVFQVKPGTIVTINQVKVCQKKYFSYTPLKDCKFNSANEYGSYFRNLYESCVADAIKTSENVGISLSSGLDSASIGALAATALKAQKKDLHCYTYVPSLDTDTTNPDNFITDETNDVKKIAALHPNMKLNFLNNHGKNSAEYLKRDLEIMELPIKAYVNFPNLMELYDTARQDGCKVVLLGQNGNGSVSFGKADDIFLELYESKQFITFYKYFKNYCLKTGENPKKRIIPYIKALSHDIHVKKIANINPDTYKYDNPFVSDELYKDYPVLERFTFADIKNIGYMPTDKNDYHKHFFDDAMFCYIGAFETKLGLNAGVVLRDPTADVRMLRFCYNLPTKYFAYMGTPRWLIRENLRDILPTDILDDWFRYGLQNSDCYDRIRRDWDELRGNFEHVLVETSRNQYFEKYAKFINFEKLNSFILETPVNSRDWEHNFDYFIFSIFFLLTMLLL